MPPIRYTLFALALGAASCASVATESLEAPPKLGALERPSYTQCLQKARGRVEQAPCIASEKQWQQEQLTLLFRRLSSRLGEDQRKALGASQSAWEAFLQAENRLGVAIQDAQGGSADLMVGANEIRWIVQRRQQLQQHLDAIQ